MPYQVTTKPFASRAQQRMAFARKMPWAKRWAAETDFAALPQKKRKKKDAPLHGPGGLLGVLGLGARKKKRTKAMSRSEAARVAALARWGKYTPRAKPPKPLHGAAVGGLKLPKIKPLKGGPKGGKGKGRAAKPKKTDAERQAEQQAKRDQRTQEREQAREAARSQVYEQMGIAPDGRQALEALRRGEQPDPAAIARGGFVDAGLVEQAADGSYRMTPAGRALTSAADSGDTGRAGDTISSSRDRLSARRTRQAEQAKKRQNAQRQRSIGGGGSKKKQPPKAKPVSAARQRRLARARERIAQAAARLRQRKGRTAPRIGRRPQTTTKAYTPTRTLDAGHSGVMVALYPDAAATKTIAAQDGVTEAPEQLHLTLCFLGDSSEQPLSTNKEKIITAIDEWATQQGQPLKGVINGVGRFFHSEEDGTNAVYVAPDVPGLPELRQSLVDWIEKSGFDYSQDHGFTPHITVAYVPEDAPTPPIRVETPITFDRATLAWGDEQYDFPLGMRTKSFAVFKDAAGNHRWLAHTTTAYRDRDKEILSTRGLEANAERMTRTKQYGPLRYWHIGLPDGANVDAPWGPGLDIGDCDFSMLIGRTLVESGTFRTPQIALKMAETAGDYEMSPGFLHDDTQPDADKAFDDFFIFERSAVPTDYARASNLFTRFSVKEQRMKPEEFERRLKVAEEKLGLTAEQAERERAALIATDKSAQQQKIAYKSDDGDDPVIYLDPQGEPGIIFEGRFVALKAAMPMDEVDAEDDPALGGDSGVDEETEMDGGAPGLEAVATAVAKAVVAELLPHLNISDKVNELKSLMGGYTKTKDDAQAALDAQRAQEVAALQGQIAEQQQLSTALQAKLKELTGDAPAAQAPPSNADGDVVAALKSAGPTNPADPNLPQLPADATPIQQMAARLMPALYTNNPQGGFQGWIPPTPPPQS